MAKRGNRNGGGLAALDRPAQGWRRYRRWFILLGCYLALAFLAGPAVEYHDFSLSASQWAGRDIVAPFTLRVTDYEELSRREKELADNLASHFRVDDKARQRGFDTLERVISLAAQAQASLTARQGEPADQAAARPAAERREAVVAALKMLGASHGEVEENSPGAAPDARAEEIADILITRADPALEAELRRLLEHLDDERGVIDTEDLIQFREAKKRDRVVWERPPDTIHFDVDLLLSYPSGVRNYLRNTYLPGRFQGAARSAIEDLMMAIVEPVIQYDRQTSRDEFDQALERLKTNPPSRAYQKGEVLVAAGEKIGPRQEKLLADFQTAHRRYRTLAIAGIGVFVAILFGLVFIYGSKFPGEAPFTEKGVALVSLPVIIAFILWRIQEMLGIAQSLHGFAFPAALIGMLSVALLGPRLAWLLVTGAGLLYGLASNFDFSNSLVALFAGFTAVGSLYSAQARSDILRSGLRVALANAVVVLAISLVSAPASFGSGLTVAMLCGLGNAVACLALTLPLMWVFERSFGVVTDFTLLELTGVRHPLLAELEEKAPGSFQHTLNVTKLAEAAATSIGANYLLVRAGGYFHDVGKLAKPRYFSENQITQEDRSVHNKLSPHMSMRIIKNHVREGIDLARKYNLPPEVAAFIPEHQGTSLISYFYDKAKKQIAESESTDTVSEEEFRYPGPKPQTIETAIVMLADSVEATVTSVFSSGSAQVNEDELRRVVRRSIAAKFDDGQFDECDLTLRDLHIISETFVKTLLGRYHHRVKYPGDTVRNGGASVGEPGVRRAGKAPKAAAREVGEGEGARV